MAVGGGETELRTGRRVMRPAAGSVCRVPSTVPVISRSVLLFAYILAKKLKVVNESARGERGTPRAVGAREGEGVPR